ncbi:13000_t:CDS:2, partial [Cetraspora pellucida]
REISRSKNFKCGGTIIMRRSRGNPELPIKKYDGDENDGKNDDESDDENDDENNVRI